ncbi:hypothetical protein [Metabacillus hrfriensis]|uniref:hypothetical protein n=1 Tax=Metabacillus hrfriensis TaxID=3048891 RepID=UPI003C12BB47
MLLESGADIKFVSDRLGHSTVTMTADVYLHITKKYEEENVSKFEKYLNTRWAKSGQSLISFVKTLYIMRLNIFSISYVE